jgi:hypothetical protein
MSQQHKRETVTAEQMTYSNMLTVNALVELLDSRQEFGSVWSERRRGLPR